MQPASPPKAASAPESAAAPIVDSDLLGLVLLARFYGAAADPDQIGHEFRDAGQPLTVARILRAGKSVGFKTKAVRSETARLACRGRGEEGYV